VLDAPNPPSSIDDQHVVVMCA